MRRLLTALSLCLLAAAPALAATSRPGWVESELYGFNHPLAQAQPAEVATKMDKMAVSPFAFYRGTAHLFYRDMANLPPSAYLNTATARVWIDGDLHLQNYGGVRDSAGNDVFDISDFDESYIGPYVWDVRRMAVSLVLAARELGFSQTDQNSLIDQFVDSYLNKLGDFKGTDDEKSYRLKAGDLSNVAKDVVQKVGKKNRSDFLAKYSAVSGGVRRFNTDASLVMPPSATAIGAAMPAYIASIASGKRQPAAFYTVKDARQRMGSGVGSLGRARYWVLIEGATTSADDDVILEMKEMGSSAVALANPGGLPATAYGNHEGARVAMSNKAGLTNTDPLIGSTTINGKDFFVKEKSPFQQDFDYTALKGNLGNFKDTVAAMGKILAKTHALADQDYDSALIPFSQDKQITDVVVSTSGFKAETRAFATDYADQVQLDHAALLAARAAGRPLY
ncbi:DUF2252 domain-containing protein [Azospirillum griseum]|uniref:DUF2252 domain-containing protein n=1 Tax=Azospirillum griseum TaxID=2496639 RepID=A0A3S0HZ99_9PROT|nr:DUF2252 family protein [Azospirillum griseum]RTR22505.1 DUF2252 domain-containing protein [Azospirillum griseum]